MHLRVFLAVLVTLLALAPAASAHFLSVNQSGKGNAVHDHWVGGSSVPGQGAGLVFSPVLGMIPAAHEAGLVTACEALMTTPAAASILAPGRTGTGCHHGD